MVITSFSLWLIKMIDLPSASSERMISNSSSVSWGVRTAVGSSRIRISAWRYKVFNISTRCWMPTGRVPTSASGSTDRPYWSDNARMRRDAVRRSSAVLITFRAG